MIVLNKTQIQHQIAQATSTELLQAMIDAYTSYSSGEANIPPVGHLALPDPGDVHIKYGHITGDQHYVIKIASGFYNNPAKGLPSSNGMMIAFNATTGALTHLLHDEGYLTDLRTAVGGAVAAQYLAPGANKIGILGTGIQAKFQLEELLKRRPQATVILCGRNQEKLEALQASISYDTEITTDVEYMVRNSNLIVTTTSATSGLIKAEWINPGTHITAMGADTPGKQELDENVLAMANIIACDSLSQCIHHGEVHKAIANGVIQENDLIELGDFIQQGKSRAASDVTVADLTGIATQDIKITLKTIE